MNRQLRDNVWDGLNDSDRARRYYGELAGRLNQRERGATLLVTAIALTSLVVQALGQQQLALWGVLLTAVASFVPVFYRVAGRVAMASYREKALGDIYAEWMMLWQDMEDATLEEREVQKRWLALSKEMNAITAMESLELTHKRLKSHVEKENKKYWAEYANRRAKEVATTTTAASATPAFPAP